MADLQRSLSIAFGAVAAAPWPFITALILAGVLIWKVLNWAYASRLSNQQSTIELLEKQLSQRTADNAFHIASNTAGHAALPQTETPLLELAKKSLKVPVGNVIDAAPKTVVEDAQSTPDKEATYVPEGFTFEGAMALLVGKTSLQAEVAVQPYLGCRVQFEGPVVQLPQ